MGSPFGSGRVETSIIGPAGLPAPFPPTAVNPARRVFHRGNLLATVDAQSNALRSVCRLGAVGGFSTEAHRHA